MIPTTALPEPWATIARGHGLAARAASPAHKLAAQNRALRDRIRRLEAVVWKLHGAVDATARLVIDGYPAPELQEQIHVGD